MKRYYLILVSSLFLTLMFQNCGVRISQEQSKLDLSSTSSSPLNSENNSESISTGDKCQDILLNEYLKKDGFYSKIKSIDCAFCHHDSQNERPKFTSSDPLIAWNAFVQKEINEGNKVSENMMGTHQKPNGRSENTLWVTQLKNEFKTASDKYSECSGVKLEAAKPYAFETSQFAMGNVFATEALTTDDLNTKTSVKGSSTGLTTDTASYSLNKYQKLVYDKKTNKNMIITLNKYSTKSYTLSLKNGKYISGFNYSPKATFKFDLVPSVNLNVVEEVIGSVKYIVGYNQVINPYFTLKNPTLALDEANTSYALVFQKMGIIINNKLMTDATVYQVLDVNICQNSAVKIMPNSSEQLIVLNQIDLAALMSFKFDLVFEMDKTKVSCTSSDGTKVDLGLPTSLTFNDLSNLNSEFGVFAKSCNSCHAGPSAAGALDLTDATQAKAKAARIQSRMNDFTNPMPRSGLLSAKERGAVDVWINSGLK